MAVKNSLQKTATTVNPLEISFMAGTQEVKLSPNLVKKYLVTGNAEKVTNQEIVLFMNLCRFQGLNPFLREAYLIKFGDKPATIVTGKAAFEKRAENNEKFRGFDAGVVVYNPETDSIDRRSGSIVLGHEELVGGWAEVYVDGYSKPIRAEVALNEYIGRKNDGTVNSQWASKPATMIRKVAKMQALREAFPNNFSGMYGAEEMNVEEPMDAAPISPEPIIEPEPQPQLQTAPQPEEASDFGDILEG